MNLLFDSQKHLLITKQNNIYKDENNADSIRIFFPKYICGYDIHNCIITLNTINSDNIGDVITLSNIKEYDNNFAFSTINISNKFTYKVGEMSAWIEVINPENEMLAKSNIVSFKINPHMEVSEYIPEQSLTLLIDWQIKMNNTLSQCKEIASKLDSYVDGLKEQIDEINCYINCLKTGDVFVVATDSKEVV